MSGGALGRLRLRYAALGSTNDLCRTLARAGYPHGTVVVADHQTAGRGRLGRRWDAEPGAALLCSILLRSHLPARDAALLTMAAAVATADAISEIAGVPASLKWPNDVLMRDAPEPDGPLEHASLKKVAGLLIEASPDSEWLGPAIAGIGINVMRHPADVATATCLARAAGRPLSRRALLNALLNHFERHLNDLAAGDHAGVFNAWRSRLVMLGQPVLIQVGEDCYAALAEDVATDGALIVRAADGERRVLRAGDVSLRSLPSHSP